MNTLDIITLRHFVAVCDTGSVSRAAEQEHVVASAVSKRVAQLEADLGVQLLVRQRKGIVPTPAGETLLEHARDILRSTRRILDDMSGYGAGVRGKVRLLATASAVAQWLPDDVAAFMNLPDHREIQVDIEEAVSRDIVRRIADGSASVGVLWDATDLQGLQAHPYRSDRLVVVTHPGHPLAALQRCHFTQTLDSEFVGLDPSSATSLMMDRCSAMAGKPLRHRAQVSNFESALRVVAAGLGIAVLPEQAVRASAAAMGLALVKLEDAWAVRRFVICHRPLEPLPRAAQLLLDSLGQSQDRVSAPPVSAESPARNAAR